MFACVTFFWKPHRLRVRNVRGVCVRSACRTGVKPLVVRDPTPASGAPHGTSRRSGGRDGMSALGAPWNRHSACGSRADSLTLRDSICATRPTAQGLRHAGAAPMRVAHRPHDSHRDAEVVEERAAQRIPIERTLRQPGEASRAGRAPSSSRRPVRRLRWAAEPPRSFHWERAHCVRVGSSTQWARHVRRRGGEDARTRQRRSRRSARVMIE